MRPSFLFKSFLMLPLLFLLLSFVESPFISMTYIYGYSNTIVVGTVTNGNQDQVAFSSFESVDKGFWTYTGANSGGATDPGRTGQYYYTLSNGNISRTGLQAGRYTLSYWAQGGSASVSGTNFTSLGLSTQLVINGWTCYVQTINLSANGSSITLSGSGKIDELRLHPFDAVMTTATYDPMVGKTSETDANNSTLYYEYDDFNRLKCIKDQSGNIRQSFVYHYQNQ